MRCDRCGPSALAAAALGVLLLVAPAARAATLQTTLDTLLPGGSNAGGLAWSGAHISDFTFESAGPVVVSPADVLVRLTVEPRLFGLDMQGTAHVQISYEPPLPDAAGPTSTVVISYRCDPIDHSSAVDRAGLRFNANVPAYGVGNAATDVTQTLTALDGSDLVPGDPFRPTEVLHLYNDGPGRLGDDNAEFLSLALITSLRVRTEIALTPFAGTDEHSAVSLVNVFDLVPEPSSAGLLPCALLATLLRRRRAGRDECDVKLRRRSTIALRSDD